MVLRTTVIAGLSLLCAFSPAWGDTPSTAVRLVHTYPGNHGFIHDTGYHALYGWAAAYRINPAGYFVRGQKNGGDMLAQGTYRYRFHFAALPGSLGGLLKSADDVVRVEVWDVTDKTCLVSRTFQLADFPLRQRGGPAKTLMFSTFQRPGHRFEPRIYWPGLSGLFLQSVDLERLDDVSALALKSKAETFEKLMAELNIDRGYVVVRDAGGRAEDVGDAAIWTGLYAAAEAWRYQATKNPDALARMESALRALHQLHARSPRPGTLVRYIYPDGRVYPDPASKDTYTGFLFAITNCLAWVRDPALRYDLIGDVQALGDHFADHDFSFTPAQGSSVDLNPFLTSQQIAGWFDHLQTHPRERRELIGILRTVHFYFFSHGQRPWPELVRMIRILQRGDVAAARRQFPAFLNGALRALHQLQRNVQRSASPELQRTGGPYGKLNRLLIEALARLPEHQIDRPEDLRVLASSALHALHVLKVMAEILPKPNRFQALYQENLWQHKALLQTLLDWDNFDEDLFSAVLGDTHAATLRSSSAHLSFLALYDLLDLERDRHIHATYETIFTRQHAPMQSDYNAMLETMAGTFHLADAQPGVGFWSLMLYPTDRCGLGERYWQREHRHLVKRYGEVGGQARDPLPINERLRDCFVWQRSARSLRGDNDQWRYPPLDYLFVYWMARANGQIGDE